MTGPQQQHDDPFGEARAQLVQGLAVLATVSEAVARWYAVGLQRRAEDQAKADRAAQVSQAAREQAEQLAREAELAEDRAERQHVAARTTMTGSSKPTSPRPPASGARQTCAPPAATSGPAKRCNASSSTSARSGRT